MLLFSFSVGCLTRLSPPFVVLLLGHEVPHSEFDKIENGYIIIPTDKMGDFVFYTAEGKLDWEQGDVIPGPNPPDDSDKTPGTDDSGKAPNTGENMTVVWVALMMTILAATVFAVLSYSRKKRTK